MHELSMLQDQLTKLAKAKTPAQRRANTRAVLLWGARTRAQIKTLEDLLTRQIVWLGANEDSPNYELRFTEWETNLRLYERSCDVLAEAESLDGIAA